MNNNILLSKKKQVEDLSNNLKKSSAFIFFNYNKVNGNDITKLRRLLFENKINMKIYKNNIFKRTIANIGLDIKDFNISNDNAICFTQEKNFFPLIKNIISFTKARKLKVKTSVLEGKITDSSFVQQLSLVNSKEDLIAELTFCLNYAITQLAFCLDKIKKD